MKFYGDLPYANGQTLDVYLPDGEYTETVVYFHGGGLEGGDKRDFYYADIAGEFASRGYAFLSVNYRKYPEAKFPDYLEDAALSVRYAKERFCGPDGKNRLYVAGQSAGAWIALMLGFDRSYLGRVGVDPAGIDGWIIDSAQPTSHFNVIRYECGADSRLQRIDRYAPLYYLDENTRFSRMLLVWYEDDMPCRPEQNELLVAAIRQFLPDADVEHRRLAGGHCHGSTEKNEDGKYDFAEVALQWLAKAGKGGEA